MLDKRIFLHILEHNCAHADQVAEVCRPSKVRLLFLLDRNCCQLLVKLVIRVLILEDDSVSLNDEVHVLGLLLEIDYPLVQLEVARPT